MIDFKEQNVRNTQKYTKYSNRSICYYIKFLFTFYLLNYVHESMNLLYINCEFFIKKKRIVGEYQVSRSFTITLSNFPTTHDIPTILLLNIKHKIVVRNFKHTTYFPA